jgi:hypothetical protein
LGAICGMVLAGWLIHPPANAGEPRNAEMPPAETANKRLSSSIDISAHKRGDELLTVDAISDGGAFSD